MIFAKIFALNSFNRNHKLVPLHSLNPLTGKITSGMLVTPR
jgi:hypothetical protein